MSELGEQLGIDSFASSLILPQGFNPRLVTCCEGLVALNKVGLSNQNLRVTGKHINLISIISDIWITSTFVPNKYMYIDIKIN